MQSGVERVFGLVLEDSRTLLEGDSSSGDSGEDIMKDTDVFGRSALSAACALGRANFARDAVEKNGADVNAPTARGYMSLHFAAMWGQLDTLKTLLDLGADLQAANFRGERAVDVALRYQQSDCAEFLQWAEARQSLQAALTRVRGILADPERVQGKLSKEDKNTCLNVCSVNSDWIQNAKSPTVQDFVDQKKHFEEVLAPILKKLSAQSEASPKTIRS
ncbi:ankyrin repeat domain-containing protein 45 [Hoplias malabaricus]|uniref:ankyrin repeat domain-containing protein 45 n=1 Tax=Hoplias malabaricus TaxID=27720 RepID=UPI0034632053